MVYYYSRTIRTRAPVSADELVNDFLQRLYRCMYSTLFNSLTLPLFLSTIFSILPGRVFTFVRALYSAVYAIRVPTRRWTQFYFF